MTKNKEQPKKEIKIFYNEEGEPTGFRYVEVPLPIEIEEVKQARLGDPDE